MRALGIDYGRARIGLALSDPLRMVATPLNVLSVDKSDALKTTAKKLIQSLDTYAKEIDLIVVGHPLELSGKKGPMAEEVEVFFSELQHVSPWPIQLWDERLTTAQVDRGFKEAGLSRKARAKLADAASAALMLQSFLDSSSL